MRTAQAVSRPRTRHVATPRTVNRQQNVNPRPRRKIARKAAHAPLPNGLSVMGLIVVVLALIGGMLVVSLNWQRNAHTLAQEEVSLRSALAHIGDERQHLLIDERRASNPGFTAARAADAGFNEIKLDERTTASPSVAKSTKPTTKPAVMNLATTKPLPAAMPKAMKPASATGMAKATVAAPSTTKALQPASLKIERVASPTLPPSIAKTASVKATLAR